MSNSTRLEVEDEEERQRRLQSMFESLNNSGGARTQAHLERTFDFGERKTYAVEPPKELLSRIHAFLPQLAASNAVLAQQVAADPSSVNIEDIRDTDEHVIQMNLGLGVFEDRSKRGDDSYSDSDASMSDSDSSSCSDDSDSSCSSTEIVTSSVIKRPMRPLPRRTRPAIVMLGDATTQS